MKKFALIILILLSLILFGCTRRPPPEPDYLHVPGMEIKTTTANSIRLQAIQDTALSVGAQSGLAWQSHRINEDLLAEQAYLDHIFNFNALILKHNVLPPVLVEGVSPLNLASPTAIRLADKVYKIVQAPRFVTTPPTWRDYLWVNYASPAAPSSTLLPKTQQESEIWDRNIKIGWEAGVDQANDIFSVNLGRLKRDYDGMILYRKLLAQNMVTPPFVAKLDLGITGNGNSMRINDQVLRITATSQLNTNAKTWKPIVRKGEAGGEDPDADQADQ